MDPAEKLAGRRRERCVLNLGVRAQPTIYSVQLWILRALNGLRGLL